MQNHIRGFQFNVDTGKVKPICYKQPQCRPHKSQAITAPVEQLQKKGAIDDDNGPRGSPVTLASKPDQAHVHWSEFVCCLCVNHRNLNAVTMPFMFPVTRVGEAHHHITVDLDAGCWQVEMSPSSRWKSTFFLTNGKKQFKSMRMGAMNAHAFFVAMASKMESEWNKLCGVRTKKWKEAEWEWLKEKMEGVIQR
jgi:hypothetical protein